MLFSKNNALKIIGLALVCIGAFGVLIGVMALIDPAGRELAGNGDFFSGPPSTGQSLFVSLSYSVVIGIGVWLVRRGFANKSN